MRKYSSAEVQKLLKAKLAESGLTEKDYKELGFEITLNSKEKFKDQPHFLPAPSLIIPYYNYKNKATGFYRIRYLPKLEELMSGIDKQTNKEPPRKYSQPLGAPPQLYLPHNLPKKLTWEKIFAEPSIPLFFTEGELKAACATKNGFFTAALGGVWNFMSKKQGWDILPAIRRINMRNRKVYVVFDSDASTNVLVKYAQFEFCEQLTRVGGAQPYIVNLPSLNTKGKTGLDDFIVTKNATAFEKLLTFDEDEDIHATQPFELAAALHKMNARLTRIDNPPCYYDLRTKCLLSLEKMSMLVTEERVKLPELKGKEDEAYLAYKDVSAHMEWLKWPHLAQAERLVYEPTKEKLSIIDNEEGKAFNTWSGLGVEAKEGNAKPFIELIDNMMCNALPEHKKWFVQWLAYPLQNLGKKMYSSVVFHSRAFGTGKSLLGDLMLDIYGSAGIMLTDTDIQDNSRNSFAEEKLFVFGDEVTGNHKREIANKLKLIITGDKIRVEPKYINPYYVKNTINCFFASNDPGAFFLEQDDRRYFVHEVAAPSMFLNNPNKTNFYRAWRQSGAASAILAYLLKVDLKGFEPLAPPPVTYSKLEMVEVSRSAIEDFVYQFAQNPGNFKIQGNTAFEFKLFRQQELRDVLRLYDEGLYRTTGPAAISRALKKMGFWKVRKDQSCSTYAGRINLWAFPGTEKEYAGLGVYELGKLYDEERKPNAKFIRYKKGIGSSEQKTALKKARKNVKAT